MTPIIALRCWSDTEQERLQQLANQLHDSQQRNHNLLTEAKRIQQQLLNHPQTALSLEQLLDALGQLQQQQFSEQQKTIGRRWTAASSQWSP